MLFVQRTRFSSPAAVPRLIGIYLLCLSRIPFALGLSIQVVSVTKYNAIVSGLPAAMNVFFSSGDSTDGTINFTLMVTGAQGSADGLGPWKLTDNVALSTKQTLINIPDVPVRWDYIVRGVTSGGVSVDSHIFTIWDEASAPLSSTTVSSSTSSTPTTSSQKNTPTTTLVSSTATESPAATSIDTSSKSQATTVASSSGNITAGPLSTSGAITLVFTSGGSVTTIVSPGNTTIATAAPDSNTTTRRSNLGGILGGVLGGLCVLLILLVVFFLRRRRRGRNENRDTISSIEDSRPVAGYRVENSVPEKGQLQQMLAERDVLQEHHDSLQANSSHSDAGVSQSGISDSEMLLRRQILAMNERILQLEAAQNSSSHLLAGDLMSQQPVPPPNYTDATVDRTTR